MNNLISIIVPIYNVEPYLEKCVDSIINQTYKNLEIILVDDGSPDHCGLICDDYAKKDSRIKVIHKVNGGLSDARNAGLDVMTGQYVGFVDSDDWIEPIMYEKLLDNLIGFNCDISFGGVSDDLEREGNITSVKVSNYGNTPIVESSVEAMKRYFLGSWAAWDKLYKAEIFKDLRYPVGEINEDEAIVLKVLDQCKQVCYTNEIFYHYIKRQNASITVSPFTEKKLAWEKHCKANLNFIAMNRNQLFPYALFRYYNSIIWSLTEIGKLPNQAQFEKDIIEMINELKMNSGKILHNNFISNKNKLRLILIISLGFKKYCNILKLSEKN